MQHARGGLASGRRTAATAGGGRLLFSRQQQRHRRPSSSSAVSSCKTSLQLVPLAAARQASPALFRPRDTRIVRSAFSGASPGGESGGSERRGGEEEEQRPSTSSSSPPSSPSSNVNNSNKSKNVLLRRFLASLALVVGGLAVSMAVPRAAAAAKKSATPAAAAAASSSTVEEDDDDNDGFFDEDGGQGSYSRSRGRSSYSSPEDIEALEESWEQADADAAAASSSSSAAAAKDVFNFFGGDGEALEEDDENEDGEDYGETKDKLEYQDAVGEALGEEPDVPLLGGEPWQLRPEKRKGSIVPDPADFPDAAPGEPESGFGVPSSDDQPGERLFAPATAGPPDGQRAMSYTQLWSLVREGHVAAVEFSPSGGDVRVETKASAPGGARAVKVGLPYDPAFLDHLVANGVRVTAVRGGWMEYGAWVLLRALAPFAFLTWAVRRAYRLGTRKKRDATSSTGKLKKLRAGESGCDFSDVAGIDAVKEEIMELVAFLRDPGRFMRLGARSPAGVLLVGAPGTGKTLLARAVAGEAGVPFFSTSGSDFLEALVGVGASRVRASFEAARAAAPCILFIDEFDGIGQARGASGGEDTVQTINQLLTEMDGFDDNSGVIVMAATNRPNALDSALTRPGRFDRMVVLPLPDVKGRADILAVHCRNKRVEKSVDLNRVARTTAGFTGAMLMNVVEGAALVAVRRGATAISEADIFQALEDSFYTRGGQEDERRNGSSAASGGDSPGSSSSSGAAADEDDVGVPPAIARAIAVYEAGRALVGSMLPDYEELAKVVACPDGSPTGFAHFIPKEEHLETGIMTRGYLESLIVARMAGRAAERLALGDNGVTTASSGDVVAATNVAKELMLRAGLSRSVGPLSCMDTEEIFGRGSAARSVGRFGTATASAATAEVEALLRAAEAKAAYGIARNWEAFAALVAALRDRGEMSGAEVRELMSSKNAVPFSDPFCDGFGWDETGELVWPGKRRSSSEAEGGGGGDGGGGEGATSSSSAAPALPDAFVARISPRKKRPVGPREPDPNPFYPPGDPSESAGAPKFGERPPVFSFEDLPRQ